MTITPENTTTITMHFQKGSQILENVNMRCRTSLILLAILVYVFPIHSFAQPKELETLRSQVNELIYNSQFDSAQKKVLRYMLRDDIDSLDTFHARMLYAETIRSSARPLEAIEEFKKAKMLAYKFRDSSLYISHVNMSIAGSYFDIPDYDKARKFAKLSIQFSPDTALSPIGHAPNYLIVGYCDYLNESFSSALEFYRKARNEYLRRGKKCELPLYYTKMASLFNARNERKNALLFIDSARAMSNTCKIDAYHLLTETTLFNILKVNKDYQSALEKSEEIRLMNEQLQYKEQRARMKKIEQEFEARLSQNKISALEAINNKNALILKKQRQLLWVSGVGLGLLAALLIGLYVVNVKRRKANDELRILNLELEEKVLARTNHLEKANERVRKHSTDLDSQNKKIMDFYHIITHNLRAPLGNLSMLVEIINETKDEQKQNELIAHIKPATEKLNQTVNDLLEAIQFSSSESQPSSEIPFEACLIESIECLQPQIDAEKAEINANFEEAPTVLYPKKFLCSLFHNLLTNALKYRSSNRHLIINIYSQKRGNRVVLTFSDNGQGIDMQKYGHLLFNAGKTFHNHPDAKGFGLYMTKMQIENNRGKIHIESAPGEGTKVVVEFGS